MKASHLPRYWPQLAPYIHMAAVCGAVLIVFWGLHLGGVEGGVAVALLSRLFGEGLAQVPHVAAARALAGLGPDEYIRRTASAVVLARTRVHEAVTDLTVIQAELELIADKLNDARTHFPKTEPPNA